MKVHSITPAVSKTLDILRWLAAFAVVLTHIDDKMLKPISETPEHLKSLFLVGWKLISDSGTEAVVIFFVISGYLVGGTALNEFLRSGNINLKRYFLRRGVRLYTVLIPTLLLGGLLDLIGSNLHLSEAVYEGRLDQLSLTVLVGNMFFLQEILLPTFGTNDALWSLTYEIAYYILFAFFLALLSSQRTLQNRIVLSLLIIGILSILNFKIILMFSIWLVGVAIRVCYCRFRMPVIIASLQLIACLIAIRLFVDWDWKHTLTGYYIVALACTASTTLLMLSIQQYALDNPSQTDPKKCIHHYFADFSYSLYTTHLPFITFIIAVSERLTGWGLAETYSSFKDILVMLGIAGACMLYAKLNHLLFESRTERNFSYLEKRLGWQRNNGK